MADALNRQNVQQVFRTIVSNKAPPDNYLLDGEISIEQNDPMRIWIGVPQILDASGKKLIYDAGAQGEAPADGQIYGRQGSTRSWQPALAVSGGILTGPLYLQGDPTAPLMAATKQYVDYQNSIAGVGKFLPLSGGTMTGPLELATDPVNPMDAVTLQFLRANQLSTVYTADTPPAGALKNTLWWDSSGTGLYVLYDDGTSMQWVVANNQNTLFDAPSDGFSYGRMNSQWVRTALVDAPIDGQTYGRRGSDGTWQPVLTLEDVPSGANVSVSATPPATANSGDLWFDSVSAQLFLFFDDGNSSAWVVAVNEPEGGLGDAPYDGQAYGRRNNLWQAVMTQALSDARYLQQSQADARYLRDAPNDTSTYGRHANGWSHVQALDANGNLGLGMTTPALASPPGTGNIGGWFFGWGITTDNYVSHLYYDGANWRHLDTQAGFYVYVGNGTASWSTSAAGAADAVATLTTIMSLDAGGLLSANQVAFGAGSNYTKYVEAGTSNRMTVYNNGGNYDYWQISTGNRCHIGNNGNIAVYVCDNQGALTIAGNGWKPGGGSWADSSDIRIKNVLGDYTTGLDAILALNPIRYRLKGNWKRRYRALERDAEPVIDDFGAHDGPAREGTEFIGLIAQEAQKVMPEMVSRQMAVIDGEKVDDLLTLDPSALPYAIINAIKELAKRVAHLEDVVS